MAMKTAEKLLKVSHTEGNSMQCRPYSQLRHLMMYINIFKSLMIINKL